MTATPSTADRPSVSSGSVADRLLDYYQEGKEAGSWVRVVFEACGDIEKLSLSRQTTTAILVREALCRRR
jgi:hypothetical protein